MTATAYQEVTNKILAALEAGVAPWVKPWTGEQKHGGLPYNAMTGQPYRGINVLLLGLMPTPSNGWLTFKQARDMGGCVRKGETGARIFFYKPYEIKATDGEAAKTVPVLKHYTVFSLDQIEGLPAVDVPAPAIVPADADRNADADTMLALAKIEHGDRGAFYRPSTDSIMLPPAGAFSSVPEYYGTALHELAHWTGHSTRLARDYGKKFGDAGYAREELVAEIAAAFLCARAGVTGRLQHAEYIKAWCDILRADNRAILQAASQAQKAADYVRAQAFGEVRLAPEPAALAAAA